ncbi:MAG: ISKra4 family transposase, partial [Solirubrobacteraceae bacterium]
MLRAVTELPTYSQRRPVPNYGEHYRAGEIMPSSFVFVESAINQVVSKRTVKRRQMRWIPA